MTFEVSDAAMEFLRGIFYKESPIQPDSLLRCALAKAGFSCDFPVKFRKKQLTNSKKMHILKMQVEIYATLYTRVTEFTFKCHVLAPATGAAERRFFTLGRNYNGFVYLFR